MNYVLWAVGLAVALIVLGVLGHKVEAYFLRPKKPVTKLRAKPRKKVAAKPRKSTDTLSSTRAVS